MNEPEWIPVTKDTLPPIGERVLIWHESRGSYLLAHLEAQNGYLLRWMLCSGEAEDTHWFPCYFVTPNSPKQWITHWCKVLIPPPPTQITPPRAGA